MLDELWHRFSGVDSIFGKPYHVYLFLLDSKFNGAETFNIFLKRAGILL